MTFVEPTPAQLARDALEVLRAGGWCKHSYEREDGAHCVMGALNVAYGRRPVLGAQPGHPFIDLLSELNRVINEQYSIPFGVVQFNDAHDISFKDVELVLEKAAINFESQVT